MALDLRTLRWARSAVPGVLLPVLHFSTTAFPWTARIALRFVLVRRSLWFLAARSTPAGGDIGRCSPSSGWPC
jgi:hypothetical protein